MYLVFMYLLPFSGETDNKFITMSGL